MHDHFRKRDYNDDTSLLINESGWAEDEHLILLVDVPSTGGKAIRYAMYEVITCTGDNWYFYEDSSSSVDPVYLHLNWYDYIIIVGSDSSNNGNMDEFSLTMTVYDSGSSYSTYKSYNFGDSAGNDFYVGIWQFQDCGQLKFGNSGKVVAKWEDDGDHGATWPGVFTDSDWSGIWGYLDDYYNSANEHKIEDLLAYYTFPDPYPN